MSTEVQVVFRDDVEREEWEWVSILESYSGVTVIEVAIEEA